MASVRRHDFAHFLHRIHLIPEWLLNRWCDRFDHAIGLYDDEADRAAVSRMRAQNREA